jgi:hypothetical protein
VKLTIGLILLGQLCFTLSSASAWNDQDGCFSYLIFYNNILDFFKHPPGPSSQAQAKALLLWWTMYVPPSLALCHIYSFILGSKVFGAHHIPQSNQLGLEELSVQQLAVQCAEREDRVRAVA